MYKNLIVISIIIVIGIVFFFLYPSNKETPSECDTLITILSCDINDNTPSCLRMFNAIEKYSKQYNIPRKYAYGIAKSETGYLGPLHWKYSHNQSSSVGAIGPMQIMFGTGQMMWPDSSFTRESLMKNINFNVETSMKLLRQLHDKYKDWKLVFGCYNTGRPCINRYAENVYNYEINFK